MVWFAAIFFLGGFIHSVRAKASYGGAVPCHHILSAHGLEGLGISCTERSALHEPVVGSYPICKGIRLLSETTYLPTHDENIAQRHLTLSPTCLRDTPLPKVHFITCLLLNPGESDAFPI